MKVCTYYMESIQNGKKIPDYLSSIVETLFNPLIISKFCVMHCWLFPTNRGNRHTQYHYRHPPSMEGVSHSYSTCAGACPALDSISITTLTVKSAVYVPLGKYAICTVYMYTLGLRWDANEFNIPHIIKKSAH